MLIVSTTAYASHLAGADLTYQYIGNGQYIVTYTFYRDCFGIPLPQSEPLIISSYSCGYSNSSQSVWLIPGSVTEITHNCPGNPTTCNGGTGTGIQQGIYTDTITLPAQCSDWVFSISDCCRNSITMGVADPSAQAMYVEASLNNMLNDHSSPVLTNSPVLVKCIGDTNYYNIGATDVSGDSLVYMLAPALASGNMPLTYLPGYSFLHPLSSNPLITIDHHTGDLVIYPTQVEEGVIVEEILQYHNGILIGIVMRDVLVYTVNCSNILPRMSGIGATGIFSTSVCPNSTLCFDIISSDPDPADSVFMSWNNGIPAATMTFNQDRHQGGHFCWTPDSTYKRSEPYLFTITIRDNGCPFRNIQIRSFEIYVSNLGLRVSSTPSVPCHGNTTGNASVWTSGQQPIHYNWYPISDTTETASNLGAGAYSVVVTDAAGCQGTAAFTIIQPPLFIHGATPVTGGCTSNLGRIDLQAYGGTPPYSYSWQPNLGYDSSITGLSDGLYHYTITDAHGCSVSDSVVMLNTHYCCVEVSYRSYTAETCNHLDGAAGVTIIGGTSPYSYLWIPTGATTSSISNLADGIYNVNVTDANGCTTTAHIAVPAHDWNCIDGPVLNSPGNEMIIYPIPVHDKLFIYARENYLSPPSISLYDILGNSVLFEAESGITGNYKTLDLHSLKPGMYFLKINFPDQVKAFRIVKAD